MKKIPPNSKIVIAYFRGTDGNLVPILSFYIGDEEVPIPICHSDQIFEESQKDDFVFLSKGWYEVQHFSLPEKTLKFVSVPHEVILWEDIITQK